MRQGRLSSISCRHAPDAELEYSLDDFGRQHVQRTHALLGQSRHGARASHQEGDAAGVWQWRLDGRDLLSRIRIAAGQRAASIAKCDGRRHATAVDGPFASFS